MVLQNYKKIIEMTANMTYIVALGVGLKCPRKIHLNTKYPPWIYRPSYGPAATRLRLMIMITWMIKKISRQTRMMDLFFLVRNQIAFAIQIRSTMCSTCVPNAQKWIF